MTLLENLRANRLILGIANVGFWVVCSAIILVGRANLESTIASISPVWIWLIALIGYTLAQGIFDWIGSANSHNKRDTNPSVAIQWIRGVALQAVVWASPPSPPAPPWKWRQFLRLLRNKSPRPQAVSVGTVSVQFGSGSPVAFA